MGLSIVSTMIVATPTFVQAVHPLIAWVHVTVLATVLLLYAVVGRPDWKE
jgi:hypothetical protein